MKVKFLLTPSAKIQGLPNPIPRAGQTAEVDNDLALALIDKSIAVAVKQPAKKPAVKPPKPPIKPVEKLKPEKSE